MGWKLPLLVPQRRNAFKASGKTRRFVWMKRLQDETELNGFLSLSLPLSPSPFSLILVGVGRGDYTTQTRVATGVAADGKVPRG